MLKVLRASAGGLLHCVWLPGVTVSLKTCRVSFSSPSLLSCAVPTACKDCRQQPTRYTHLSSSLGSAELTELTSSYLSWVLS